MDEIINEKYLLGINLAILAAALAVILVGLHLKKRSAEARAGKTGNAILVCLGGLALLSYVNITPFHTQPHYAEMFHYYIGSKYFPEIGYTRLYACTVRAEAESYDPNVQRQAYRRTVRDLETNELAHGSAYFFDDTFCKARFSASRWDEFKKDLRYFHTNVVNSMAERNWDRILIDHGFNASPVWMLMGGPISNSTALSNSALLWITRIDVALLLGSVACLIWAFGLPVAAFAVIVCTASGGTDWLWIQGSLLRLDWLFMAVLSVCAMKRGHFVLAGVALGCAAALRVFPAVFALGPLVGLLYAIYKRQYDLKLAYIKLFAGMMVSVAVLVAAATATYGGDALRGFIDNTRKHSAMVAYNNVGLRTVLISSSDTYPDEPAWVAAKLKQRQQVVPIYVAIVAVSMLFFVPAVISGGAWQAIALGATFIPFVWADLSNYYYMFLMVVATLFAANRKVALPLLGMGMVMVIARLSNVRVDEAFAIFSAAVCLGFGVVWWQISSYPLLWWKTVLQHNVIE